MKQAIRRKNRAEIAALEELPNVGPSIAADLNDLGVDRPDQLKGRDPYQLYDDLCRITGKRHDPCLLDVFISVVRFMDDGKAKPWWAFTAERKRELAARAKNGDRHGQSKPR
jgi:hypothetical protein